MRYCNSQIRKRISTGNRNEEEERTFGTPAELEDFLAETAGITPRGSRGSRGGKGIKRGG